MHQKNERLTDPASFLILLRHRRLHVWTLFKLIKFSFTTLRLVIIMSYAPSKTKGGNEPVMQDHFLAVTIVFNLVQNPIKTISYRAITLVK